MIHDVVETTKPKKEAKRFDLDADAVLELMTKQINSYSMSFDKTIQLATEYANREMTESEQMMGFTGVQD